MERQLNTRLAAVIDEADVSHLGLASRICEVAKEWRVAPRPAHTQIARWVEGQKPRGITPALIAEALSRKLGRRVTLAEIGMEGATTSPEAGLIFADVPSELIENLNELMNADLRRAEFLRGKVTASALNGPAFEWLLASPVEPPEAAGRRRIGASDVEAIRSTASMFADLDNRFGGAHARTAAVQYLSSQAIPLLNGTYSGPIGRALFSAVAEFSLSVAWMAYDSGWHGLGRRYSLQALALAHQAGDRLLGASTLSALSHQANYLGEHKDAVNLARAAQHGVKGHAPALLEAQFAAMEARAAAALGNSRSDCLNALMTAEDSFNRHREGSEPAWISYFDEAELADEFAHCFRDLGRPEESHRYANACLAAGRADDGSDEYPRSRTFSRIVLATSYLEQGELEEACSVATAVLPRVEETASVRCTAYLRDFHRRTRPHRDHAVVVEFTEQARPLLEGRHLASI
ncbi:transcriptional regulator [Actinomadura barringtoniae]|uniref:Transcriptional regulator n=1 Tax=Actinomadura barringtoniae TaxID=1427535 RepID=A0A939PBP1_9ACTN|nr:transcriptional regulator [Actinomadura barringtoniae]MBO2447108.1 transcriptional regulator [Actinomadura barringtoniae]